MEKTIVRYYRKGGKLRGCVVGILKDSILRTGWSLYHKRLEEMAGIPFTKKVAREKAIEKAKRIPQSLIETEIKVREQCCKMQMKAIKEEVHE